MIRALIKKSLKSVLSDDWVAILRSLRGIMNEQGPIRQTESDAVQKNTHFTSEESVVLDDNVQTESDLDSEEVDLEVFAKDLEQFLERGELFQILDIREPYETQHGYLKNSWLIPMNDIPNEINFFSRNTKIIITCAQGVRSYGVAHYFREQGFEDVWSLGGGVASWADHGFVFPQRGQYALGSRVSVASHVSSDVDALTAYGWIQNIHKDGEEVLYDIGFWTFTGLSIISKIKAKDIEPFQL